MQNICILCIKCLHVTYNATTFAFVRFYQTNVSYKRTDVNNIFRLFFKRYGKQD